MKKDKELKSEDLDKITGGVITIKNNIIEKYKEEIIKIYSSKKKRNISNNDDGNK